MAFQKLRPNLYLAAKEWDKIPFDVPYTYVRRVDAIPLKESKPQKNLDDIYFLSKHLPVDYETRLNIYFLK
jgi:hypothetical protein